MRLSRHIVGVIIALIIIALAGLVLVQLLLINNAREFEKQAFQRNVLAALNAAAQKLETGETARRMMVTMGTQRATRDSAGRTVLTFEESLISGGSTVEKSQWFGSGPRGDSTLRFPEFHGPTADVELEENAIRYRVPAKQHVRVMAFSAVTGRDTTLVDTVKLPGDYRIELNDTSIGRYSYMFKYANDSATVVMHIDSTVHKQLPPTAIQIGLKQEMVRKVADNLIFAEMEPIERRVDSVKLDSILASSFRESGIELSYAYGVIGPNGSPRLVQPGGYREEIVASPLRTRLFPNDIFAAPSDLVVYFPEERSFIWQQVTPLLVATMVFMLIITVCFAYTIRTIMRQRRFGALTVDFINNMTHEFKTPISTVTLAAEALLKSEAASNDRVVRYGRMILDENHRMRNQVDKILQMAVLEEGDYELNLTEVDLHQIIHQAAEQISLHIEHRDGQLICKLDAVRHIVKADPLHLTNVLSNILDNANKYSSEKPQIMISTRNGDSGIHVRIEDHGAGIKEKDLKQVFDKYYRVPSGNVHDVKGFGLGLAYVKLMVDALGGKIRIDSQFGKGTQVEICFPVVDSAEQEA
jgi:two-component system phosphate regulon sensor histidine kinase PhoR